MAQLVFAARIYLNSVVSADTDVGIYEVVAENSQVRWIESDISALSPTVAWKTGVLTRNPFEPIGESYDGKNGGNLPRVGGSKVRVANTIDVSGTQTQVDKIFADAGISFQGMVCELVEFEISGGALVDADGDIRFRGICGKNGWTEVENAIPVENSNFKRKSNLSTIITSENYPNADNEIQGQIVPVTFGQFLPEFDADGNPLFDSYAKLVRVANKQTQYTTEMLFSGGVAAKYPDTKVFPIMDPDSSVIPTLAYKIKIPEMLSGSLANMVGFYIKVIEGTGAGEFRRIASAIYDGINIAIDIVLDDYFEDTLNGNPTATGQNQSWIAIYDIERQYGLDLWPCKDYLDDLGNVITQGLNLFSYVSDKRVIKDTDGDLTDRIEERPIQFIRLPQYAYEDSAGGDNNQVVIDVKLFEGNPDRMNSFIIKPMKLPKLSDAATLDDFGVQVNGGSSTKISNGQYWLGQQVGLMQTDAAHADPESLVDQDSTTYLSHQIPEPSIYALTSKFPDYPKGLTFDEIYLLLFQDFPSPFSFQAMTFGYRRFIGTGSAASVVITRWHSETETWRYNNTPDFYYSDLPDNNNFYFFANKVGPVADPTGGSDKSESGYMRIPLALITDRDLYESYVDTLLYLTFRDGTGTSTMKFYEMAMAFRKVISIQKSIYTPMQGRIYNDTWDSRRTAADMIGNPVDMLEMIMRLQNWSEVGETKDWGHEYADAPLIDTATTEGGFDYEDLDILKKVKAAQQVMSRKDAESDALARSLCKDFFLVSFQDATTGDERVGYIGGESLTTPATTITLSDIIGNIGEVAVSPMSSIYVEPFVRYAKNNATGDFDRVIRVSKVAEDSYVAGYVEGIPDSPTAEMIWTRAHVLWQNNRTIEEPPADMTDKKWIYEEDDAVTYLSNWLSYMGATNTTGEPAGIEYQPKKRISFSVPYQTGKTWFITQHHNLQLPHQTNDQAIEFVIESISKVLQKGKEQVDLKVMLYGDTAEIAEFIQDTYTAGVQLDDWADTYDTKAEEAGNGKDIQDQT